ncbi:hypothetical protein IW261DRAFT_1477165 [Armillaria novae-zelandiae]|uniref:DUF1748-domain-containing protein n=1 Tax=Armillaria novae-zelandiae TaxID=153914 RepID=A0AA39PAG7_9AGAR|nr:hypothetical protein IW261DRAFT_1477165 [Armillaria novae-zelandiae]
MALGRIVHYAVDAVLLSTVLAGVRRSSGFTPNTSAIPEPTLRSVVDTFLSTGETVFDLIQMKSMNTEYFKKDSRTGSRSG